MKTFEEIASHVGEDSSPRILIIDDDSTSIEVISEYLRRSGFVPLVAQNGKSGIKKAQYTQPEIILLDVLMPGIDGFETCSRLKSDPTTENIPVILMTSLSEVEDKVKGFEVGAADFLSKPFQHKEILTRIGMQLRICALTREHQQANEELIKHRDRLEELVEKRYAEIQATNVRLNDEIDDRKQAEEELLWKSSVNVALAELSRALINPAFSIQNIADITLEYARKLTDSQHGFVSSIDPLTKSVKAHTLTGMMGKECQVTGKDQRIDFPIGQDGCYSGLWGYAINSGKAFYTNSPEVHEASKGVPAGHIQISNFLAAPAMVGFKPVGQIALSNSKNGYSNRELDAIKRLAELYSVGLQRKQAEENLQKKDFIIRSASSVIATTNLDGILTYVNPAFLETWGFDLPDEVIGRPFSEFWMVDDKLDEIMAALMGEERKWSCEIRAKKKDGSLFDVFVSAATVIDYKGNPIALMSTSLDISEYKQSEDALLESERRLSTLMNNLPGIAYRCANQKDWLMEFISDGVLEITGYAASDFMSQKIVFSEVILPEDAEYVWDAVQAGVKEKRPYVVEYRIRTASGQTKWVWEKGMGILSDDDKLLALEGFMTDITERKQADQECERTRIFMQTVIDAIPDEVMVINRDHTIALANRLVHQKMDGKDPLATCMKCHEVSHKSMTPCIGTDHVCPLEQVMATRVPVTVEHIHVDGEGRSFSVEVVAAPIFDKEGAVVQIIESCRDVTDRNQAEKALKENEERYRIIMEASLQGTYQVDYEGYITFANPLVAELTGYSPEELTGLPLDTLFPSGEAKVISDSNVELLYSGKPIIGENTLTRKDGNRIEVHFSCAPVLDENGEYTGFIGSILDITETKRLRELKSRARRLETAGQVAGQVAHDFNNLLSPLMAFPELIRDELPPDHPVISYVNTIENSAKKITEINQQLLTLGRRGHFSLELLNLNDIVRQIVNDMKPLPKELELNTDLSEELMKFQGGGVQIFRVLLNLINNARDAVQDNGDITIRCDNCYVNETSFTYDRIPKDEYVKLTVSDNGSGIPEDIIQNIFDPFFSTKTSDQRRGSGLGLSIVDSVVKDHNGFIDIESEANVGTSIYIYFPIFREEIDEVPAGVHIGDGERILIVDDDKKQRTIASLILKKSGYTVNAVENGEKAIEYLKENPQDLLVLDMIMPNGIDGAETFAKAIEINPSQKAIIMSGYPNCDRTRIAQEMGAGEFVEKPLTFKRTIEAVRSELDKKVKV